jgi:hypothetical protein
LTAKDSNYQNQDVAAARSTGTQDATNSDQAKRSAGAVADQAKQAATQVTDQAKDAARSQLATRKDQTAQGLHVVSSAISDMGDKLRQSDQTSSYAGVADQAANQVERLSQYLRGHNVRQIVNEVEDWARREPALALGGAFVAGLLAARFLKSNGVQARSSGGPKGEFHLSNRSSYQPYRRDPRYGNDYGAGYRPASRYWDEQTGSPDVNPQTTQR